VNLEPGIGLSMEFKVDLNHQELAAAVAGEVLKILKSLLEKGTGEDKEILQYKVRDSATRSFLRAFSRFDLQ
jgi:hypothetical protein